MYAIRSYYGEDEGRHFPAVPIVRTVGNIDVMVDPNVEMMNVLYRLSGLQPDYVPAKEALPFYADYYAKVDDYFGPYAYGPAVSAIRLYGMAYFRPSEFGMYLNSDDSDFILKTDNEKFIVSEGNARDVPYYRFSTVRKAVRDFRITSDYDRFFLSNGAAYGEMIEKHVRILKTSDFGSWLEDFYGIEQKGKSRLYVTKLTGNYGISFVTPKGKPVPYTVVLDQPSEEGSLFLISHEFSHPMTREIVKELYDDTAIRAFFDSLYAKDAFFFNSFGYTDGCSVLNEIINQSCANKFLETVFTEETMLKLFSFLESRKYAYVHDITDFLDNYQNDREKYKTLKDFVPEMKRFLVSLE